MCGHFVLPTWDRGGKKMLFLCWCSLRLNRFKRKKNLARRVFYWYFCNLWWACMTSLSLSPLGISLLLKKFVGFAWQALHFFFFLPLFTLQLGFVSASILAALILYFTASRSQLACFFGFEAYYWLVDRIGPHGQPATGELKGVQ